jgi:hypothetical protein
MTAVLTKHYDLVLCNTPTVGTGSVVAASAVAPYMNFTQGGVQSGDTISYSLIDVAGGNSETGWGVATLSGSTWTLTRNPTASTNSGSNISLSGSATISISIISQDIGLGLPQLLNTVTGSGVASLADTTSITSTFTSYTLRFTGIIPSADGISVGLQVYANGGWVTSSVYGVCNYACTFGMGSAINTSTTASKIYMDYTPDNNISHTYPMGGTMDLFNIGGYMTTRLGCTYYTSGGTPVQLQGSGAYAANYAVTGIRLIPDSGTISGTMKIYGNP